MRSSLFLFSLLVPLASATIGFNTYLNISVSQFECMRKNNYDFFISNVWDVDGRYNIRGMESIRNARAAGFTFVDAYMEPSTINCAHGAIQVEAVINKLRSTNTTIGGLWLHIEWDFWPDDTNNNVQLIADMTDAATRMGVQVGIYTKTSDWSKVAGNWTAASQYPLWWSDDGAQNFEDFVPFGGWEKQTTRQTTGLEFGKCGLLYNTNWRP